MRHSIFAIAFSILFALTATADETGAASNLIQNPDFSKTYNNPPKALYWGVNFSQKGSGVFTPGAEGGVLDLSEQRKHAALLQELAYAPKENGTKLELKFQFQGTVKNIAGTLHALDAAGKELKIQGRAAKAVPSETEWKEAGAVFTIPEGTVKLRLALRAYGAGKIAFKQVQLVEKQTVQPEK